MFRAFNFLLPPCMQLVVVRADLNGHLKALKDYFLLAKGDFFQVKLEILNILTGSECPSTCTLFLFVLKRRLLIIFKA